ncbi:hypothetical protein BKA66DRAFT_286 [Pyrenochaeta sp. MPI-SDFR-AT-0127]|nr:hypothetical protein BKA66DRAFT_286 [Pyrenochaeta sp. MPI-SDFR-AT-0127]
MTLYLLSITSTAFVHFLQVLLRQTSTSTITAEHAYSKHQHFNTSSHSNSVLNVGTGHGQEGIIERSPGRA